MQTGERIRTLREDAGFSQNKLAEMAGISQTHLRRVELGQAGISVDHLEMICDALKITLKEFFDVAQGAFDFFFKKFIKKSFPLRKAFFIIVSCATPYFVIPRIALLCHSEACRRIFLFHMPRCILLN